MFPNVSIIVPVKANNYNLEECIRHCLQLEYPFFEIIVLPDNSYAARSDQRLRVIATGPALPAAKRDIGCDNANGQLLAFLDDDTYPEKDWLKHAVVHFTDAAVGAVCGPAVTPEDEPFLRKASGSIYESIAVSGPARYRYVPLKKRTTDDFPSCNFIIRKSSFLEAGGFQTKFWPGEDTILCSQLVHTLNKKIVYDPLVFVYHHRRQLFESHMHQIKNYALHRGYFVKRFPKTSLRFGYFLPSFIVLGLCASMILWVLGYSEFLLLPLFYGLLVLLCSFKRSLKMTAFVFLGTIITHSVYGLYFIKGLCSQKLPEE